MPVSLNVGVHIHEEKGADLVAARGRQGVRYPAAHPFAVLHASFSPSFRGESNLVRN